MEQKTFSKGFGFPFQKSRCSLKNPAQFVFKVFHLGFCISYAPKMTVAGMTGSAILMDPGTAFTLVLSCPRGLSRSRVHVDFSESYDRIPHPDANLEESINEVHVDFSESYDRIPHPDANLEESINEIWNRRSEKNPLLYNGKKFRYGGHTMHLAEGDDKKSSVCLHLGLTDYRTFVGTNLNPFWGKFLVASEDDPIRCQHTACPLGNGAIVETANKRVLVLQRSHNVGEFPGYFVFPGGHSEEMFEGIVREVVEEIGVPAESLSDPIFIGISRRDLNVRPTAFFFIKCNLESHEIQQLYSRAQDGYESTQLYALLREELLKMSEKMPGCHRGGYELYELMMKANSGDQI